MNAVSYSDLRKNLKSYLDKVYFDNDTLIITRKNDENLVLTSIEEYNSLTETNYLLSSEANAHNLSESIEQYKKGHVSKRELLKHE